MTDVWWARLDDADRWRAVAGPADRQAVEHLRRADDRDRSLVARVVARLAVAVATGLPVPEVELVRRCRDCARPLTAPHGQLVVQGQPDVHLSVSHSGNHVAVALASSPVGIDVEDLREATHLSYGLTAHERAELAQLPAGVRPEAALRAWVVKEALVKATGLGLRLPLEQVELAGLAGVVALIARAELTSEHAPRRHEPAEPSPLTPFRLGPAAVAACPAPPVLHPLRPPAGAVAALVTLGAAGPLAERPADRLAVAAR